MVQRMYTAVCKLTGDTLGIMRLEKSPEGFIKYNGTWYETEYQVEDAYNLILECYNEEEL